MAANGRGNMRPAGRSPPFLAIGLFVALVILGFNYWSLSSRNGEQANEISLMESELRLVNAKKTSAEKRSEAISDKVTELEKQLSEQKTIIASNQAEVANIEKEKQTFIERTNELENEVKNIRDQQLPSCETDKKNLQQEVEQLQVDIEAHKNKQCEKSACEPFIGKERDGTIEDMYKVVGALPLISMHRSGVNLGSYKDQIASLATKMDHDAALKQQQQQPVMEIQQQQPRDVQEQVGYLQQQQQPAGSYQQQQQPQPAEQQQPVEQQQQQQQPIEQQQQQQQPIEQQQQQQQQPIEQQQQQQQPIEQQQPVNTAQQQQPGDTLPQVQPAYPQQQQQMQTADQNVETGQGVAMQPPGQDTNQAGGEVGLDKSNVNVEDRDTMKAADADAQFDTQKANMTKPAVMEQEQMPGANTTTTKATTTGMKPGSMIGMPLKAPNVTVTGNVTATNKYPVVHNGNDVGIGADGNYDDDDDDAADANDDGHDQEEVLTANNNEEMDDEYDYDDDDDDDDIDEYNYDEKINNELKKEDNTIDEMFQRDRELDRPLH